MLINTVKKRPQDIDLIIEGDIIEVSRYSKEWVKYEVMFVYPTIPLTMVVLPLKPGKISFTIEVTSSTVRKTGEKVKTQRRKLSCPKCGNSGIEIGTVGTQKPVFTCYVCNWIINPNWIPSVIVKKIRAKRKSKK